MPPKKKPTTIGKKKLRFSENLIITIVPIIMGMVWTSIALVAKQDGMPDFVGFFFIFSGLLISLIGFWNILMSFTFEEYIGLKFIRKNAT